MLWQYFVWGRQKQIIKLVAYDSLIRRDFSTLPICLQGKIDDIHFISVQAACKATGDKPKSYFRTFSKYGYVIFAPAIEQYAVFYNENLSEDMIRWCKCIGLAYIDLGLVKTCRAIHLLDNGPDTFAQYFACPDAVLEACSLKTAEEIMEYCKVPFQIARKKEKKVSDGYSKTTLDETLKNQFQHFISFLKEIKRSPKGENQ